MHRSLTRGSKKAGLAPGALVHIGERKVDEVKMTVMSYNEESFREEEISGLDSHLPLISEKSVTWLNIDGIHQSDAVERVGTHFGLHPLTMEDIVNSEQRAKMEEYEDYLFIVLKMICFDESGRYYLKSEQISLILKPNLVISFKETEGDIFGAVKQRIKNGKGKLRRSGSDYLAYTLIDAIVDNYFVILERIGEVLENLQTELITTPTNRTLQSIHKLKHEMLFLRRAIWPIREMTSNLTRAESPIIHGATSVFLRDVHDHVVQMIDTVETFREMLSGMLDLYLSSISNRMNEIIKVLTIISTIFMPLTFIAGVYGMNFRYMPELDRVWGYPAVLILMASIAVLMLFFFRRKKWL
jgi:magnesium transporter